LSLPSGSKKTTTPFMKLHTTQYANETLTTTPHGVHLTSINNCHLLYYFKLFFQAMTKVDVNKEIMSTIIDTGTNHYHGNAA
jgi:hypothetical protein